MDLNLPNVFSSIPTDLKPLIRYYDPDPEALANLILESMDYSIQEPVRIGAIESLCKSNSWSACGATIARFID